ncbi:MAG: PD-(D/E)XK motif protein [Thiobacillaceae bacterium]
MGSIREQLTTSWAKLAVGASGPREWRALRLDVPHVLNVFAAVRESDCTRAILFECANGAAPPWRMRFESEGLALIDERDAREGVMRVALVVERPDLESVVLVIADDLVRSSIPAANAADAMTAVAARLSAWQTCLKLRRDGFGRERMLGLFGELIVMERLGAAIGFDRSVENWTGPDRGLHDFELAGEAIEVKTTSGSAGLMHITGLDQLDIGGLDSLTLCRVVVVPDDRGVDIDRVVARIRAAADGFGHRIRQAVDRGLLMTGYVDANSVGERYEKLSVVAVEGYEVRDAFPRLTRGIVAGGIVAAEYRLDSAGVTDYRMSDESLERAFGRFAKGG